MIQRTFMRGESQFSFNADGMRKLAYEDESKVENYEYDCVADKIMEAAANGQFSIKVSPPIDGSTEVSLTQLGFEISGHGDNWTKISW